jgi:hypothetical protein
VRALHAERLAGRPGPAQIAITARRPGAPASCRLRQWRGWDSTARLRTGTAHHVHAPGCRRMNAEVTGTAVHRRVAGRDDRMTSIVGASVRLHLDDARCEPRPVTGAHEELVEKLGRELERVTVVERSGQGSAACSGPARRHRASHSRCPCKRSRAASSWRATGTGPAPPGVVLRRTALPGSRSPRQSGPRRGRSMVCSTGRRAQPPGGPTTDDRARLARVPPRQVLGEVGGGAQRIVGRRDHAGVDELGGRDEPAQRERRAAERRTAVPCLPAGRGCRRAGVP